MTTENGENGENGEHAAQGENGVHGRGADAPRDGLERINPPHLAPPAGFSHGVRAASGTMVFLAGQTALDGSGRIVGDGVVEQFERALTNLLDVAAAAGAGPSDLAKLTVFAVDVADYRRHARDLGLVWKRLVGGDYPAMAVIGTTRLWDEAALVEIEGIAVVR
ncbi:RidA family protein [Streptomyces sp. NBC_01456]|uniref:RidA family protein n=1 Tax=unclassified Streptomyces TaxID=2593676 RepID=UPI002E333610|nr:MULTISPECIES: RidA family protein [unclassified Streptomyces]